MKAERDDLPLQPDPNFSLIAARDIDYDRFLPVRRNLIAGEPHEGLSIRLESMPASRFAFQATSRSGANSGRRML